MPAGCKVRATLLTVAVALSLAAALTRAETLKEQLYAIDQMRAFDKTPFEAVEKKADVLLKEFSSPEDQALIYFTVAEVYAQSGQVMPQKTSEYAKKAVSAGLDPTRSMLAYLYWGDSIQVLHRGVGGAALADARREAVMPYLLGLKVAVEQKVPDEVQDPPILRVPPAGPDDSAIVKEERRRYAQELARWERTRLYQDLAKYRQLHTEQIAYMYSRLPFATNELESLAKDVLKDGAAVDRLLARVKARVRERIESMGGGIPRDLPKELGVTTSPSVQVVPGEPSIKPEIGAGRAHEGKRQEAPISGRSEKDVTSGSPVLVVIIVAVLAGGLLTGVVIWRRGTARCRR
jgi:hypothetical protein